MVLSWQRLVKSGRQLPAILREYFVIFLSLHAINVFFNQWMIYLQQERMQSRDDMYLPLMLAIAYIGFAVQTVVKTIWTFIICHFSSRAVARSVPVGTFLREHVELGLIESLRAFFRAVLWCFVFIFPGLHKMIRYQFVLYIVGLDESYQRGERDALEGAEQITKGHFLGLATLLTIFAFLSLATTSGNLFFSNPLEVILVESLSFIFMIVETIYLLFLFEDLRAEKGWTR